MEQKSTRLISTKQMYAEFENLQEKVITYNAEGFLLGGDSCKACISVFVKENEKTSTYKFLADNTYTSVLLQFKLAEILGKANTEKLYFRFGKDTLQTHSKQKGIDYMFHFLPYSNDVGSRLNSVINLNNAEAIKSLKNSVAQNKIKLEQEKVSEDTLYYFLNKSQKNAVREYERIL